MADLTYRRNAPIDLAPLGDLIRTPEEMELVNPNARFPFDAREWAEKWLQEADDASYWIVDEEGAIQGHFALRVGIGPEVRHLTYVIVSEAARGGAGAQMAQMVREAAQELGALTVTLKVETDNAPALAAYQAAGYEELSRRGGMATMRLDLG